ncbi:MAG: hypothetical protein ACLQDY_28480 [Streptosporangiaceae bacterium]
MVGISGQRQQPPEPGEAPAPPPPSSGPGAGLEQSLASASTVRRLVESSLIGVVTASLDGIFEANDAFLRLVG